MINRDRLISDVFHLVTQVHTNIVFSWHSISNKDRTICVI